METKTTINRLPRLACPLQPVTNHSSQSLLPINIKNQQEKGIKKSQEKGVKKRGQAPF
jgi:hypothetical protein